jgi:glycosyltransferase involved in cell wall biosynthesis
MRSDVTMKILIIGCYPPDGSGGELQTQLQVREMAKRGHDVTVIDVLARYSSGATDREGGVAIDRIVTPRIPLVRSVVYHAKVAWSVWRRGRCVEVAQLNNIGMALVSSVPMLGLMGIPRILVIWGSADPQDEPFRPGLRAAFLRHLARRAERVVSLATSSIEHLTKQRFPSGRIVYIPNGVDAEKFRPRTPGETQRSPDDWPAGGPIVISVGRLVAVKAFDVLLDAWAMVLHHHPEAHLAIAGDGPLRESLLQQAVELGIAGRVTFFGRRSDVPELLRAADIYVSSSRSEGMSNSLLEALASALPVVATRVGAAEDTVDDGVTGLLVPSENAVAIAEALSTLIKDPLRRRGMAERARARAMRDFEVSIVVDRYLRLYQDLS